MSESVSQFSKVVMCDWLKSLLEETIYIEPHFLCNTYCLIVNHVYELPYVWSSYITLKEEWADILSNIVNCPCRIKDIEKYKYESG